MKPTIALDIDDTVLNFSKPLLSDLNASFNKNVSYDELLNQHWVKTHFPEAKLNDHATHEFYWRLVPSSVTLFESDCWKLFKDTFNIHVVTARSLVLGEMAMTATSSWLKKWSLGATGLSITHPDENKVHYVPSNTIAFIEDSPKVAKDALEAGKHVYMINRPWNTSFLYGRKRVGQPMLTKADTLEELVRQLLKDYRGGPYLPPDHPV